MNLNDQKETSAAEHLDSERSVDKSRRSFSKKGLIAPVIMTLANRSAWGAREVDLCTQSGFTSFTAASSQTPVYNKRVFTPPPNSKNSYSNLPTDLKNKQWGAWAEDNDLQWLPDDWDYLDWEKFVVNCYQTPL